MWFNSIKLIERQNRFVYLLIFSLGLFLVVGSVLSYPGEEGLKAYLDLVETAFGQVVFENLLDSLGSENSGLFLYFILLYFLSYMSFAFPVFGLWIGGAGIPDEINSNMGDIFIASPHKKGTLALRHLLAHGILFTLLTGLLFCQIPLVFELSGHPINYDRVLTAFILLWIKGIAFFALSFFFSLLSLRSDVARGVTGFVFLMSLMVQFVLSPNPNLENIKYLNILYYTSLNSVLLEGKGLIIDNFVPLFLTIVLFIGGIFIFIKKDPLPLQFKQSHDVDQSGLVTQKKSLFPKIEVNFKINDYIKRILGKFSPISAEQWTADGLVILFCLTFLFLSLLSIVYAYPKGEEGTEEALKMFVNNPIVKAILREHAENIVNDPLGYFHLQFYGYTCIYFAPIVIITAGSIVERDYSSKTIDLIFGNPITPRQVFFARIFTVFCELCLLAFVAMITLLIGEYAIQVETQIIEQMIVIALIPLVYTSFLCLLIAVAIVFPPNYRKMTVYGLGGWTIILWIFPYLAESLMPLRYLSLFYYFDPVGLISQSFQFQQISLFFGLIVVLISSVTFINYYSNKMTVL